MTAGEYRRLLEDDARTIPDLFYDVQRLLVDDNEVACLIRFDCTPVDTFQDLRPSGSRISFSEHVFYHFRGDHIVQVWSLLDVAALQRQLTH